MRRCLGQEVLAGVVQVAEVPPGFRDLAHMVSPRHLCRPALLRGHGEAARDPILPANHRPDRRGLRGKGKPSSQRVAARPGLQQPPPELAFREEAPDFSTTPACVGRCVYEICGGLLNTKLVEDLNKLQREHECRDTNRQEVSPSLSWRAGIQHNLLGTYDRQEIKVSCLTNMPRDYESDAFYNRNIVKNETAEHKKLQHDLKKVTGPATWYICTPESQQQTFANLALLTEIGDAYHKVETAWHASLLPEHQVVTKSSQASTAAAKYYFVVRSYRNAALAWEMSCVNRTKPKEKEFAFKKVTKLEWLFLFNKDDYLVHKLTAHSPSRVWMLNEKQTGAGCIISSSMEPSTLEQHRTKHGFSGIPEDILKKMCNEWEVGVASVPKGVSEQQALQTALTLHHDPATTAEEVLAKVFDNSGALEGECSDEILEEVQQIMEDSVIQQDRDKISRKLLRQQALPEVERSH